MARSPAARPAKKPARTVVVSDRATAASGPPDVVVNKALCDGAKPGSRVSLVKRVTKVIEREMDLIEQIIGRTRGDESRRTEAERRARTLAVLARTLTELKKGRIDDEEGPAENDDRPRDLDELRRRLSERLARRLNRGLPLPDGRAPAGRDDVPE